MQKAGIELEDPYKDIKKCMQWGCFFPIAGHGRSSSKGGREEEEIDEGQRCHFTSHGYVYGPVHPAYNPYFSTCFFSQNSVFLSQQINQSCFSVDLSAQPNGAIIG
jgi:hypothetical protein